MIFNEYLLIYLHANEWYLHVIKESQDHKKVTAKQDVGILLGKEKKKKRRPMGALGSPVDRRLNTVSSYSSIESDPSNPISPSLSRNPLPGIKQTEPTV